MHFLLILLVLIPLPSYCSQAKSIVITCATGELGSSMARLLANDHHLILAGRDVEKLQALQTELAAKTDRPHAALLLDYSDAKSISAFVKNLSEYSVGGYVLLTPRPSLSLSSPEEEWLKMLQSCFTGPQAALQGVIEQAKEKTKIVVIAGTTSVQVMPEYGPSSVLRCMWAAYAKVLSHNLGPKNIHVNTLSPGVVLTDFHKRRIEKRAESLNRSFDEQLAIEVADTPLKRFAEPQEVAKAVRFLLSDDSDSISGVNLVIDGGKTQAY